MGTGSFPCLKWPGRCFNHSPPSSNEVKEKVELDLYPLLPNGASQPVLGWTLPLPSIDRVLRGGSETVIIKFIKPICLIRCCFKKTHGEKQFIHIFVSSSLDGNDLSSWGIENLNDREIITHIWIRGMLDHTGGLVLRWERKLALVDCRSWDTQWH
jgi:hypothetical protein